MPPIPALVHVFLLSLSLAVTLSCATDKGHGVHSTNASRRSRREPLQHATPGVLERDLVRLMRAGIETRSPNHSFFTALDEERAGSRSTAPTTGTRPSSPTGRFSSMREPRPMKGSRPGSWIASTSTLSLTTPHSSTDAPGPPRHLVTRIALCSLPG